MNDLIDTLFETFIFSENLKSVDTNRFEEIAKNVYSEFQGKSETTWACETFSTINSYDLTKDNNFDNFHKIVEEKVAELSLTYGNDGSYKAKCFESWFNVAFPGQNQEYHIHPNSHFSAVFYVKIPKNSGAICFNSPMESMYPLPFNSKQDAYFAKEYCESDLVIFRSNLQHMVYTNKSDDVRVSIAMNFKMERKDVR